MNQFQAEFGRYRNRYFWAAVTAVLLIAALTVSVADAGQIVLQIIFVQADPQMIDTDGDGRLDPFSADIKVYEDGTAAGVVIHHRATDVTLKRGVISCENGETTAVLSGIQRQYENGQWIEGEEVEIEVRPGRDSSGSETLIWAIDSDDYRFYSNGKFLVAKDFCDEQ